MSEPARRTKPPEVDNTYRLTRFPLTGENEVWVCVGVGGCGSLVADRKTHDAFHAYTEVHTTQATTKLRELERVVERLKTSSRLPRRG